MTLARSTLTLAHLAALVMAAACAQTRYGRHHEGGDEKGPDGSADIGIVGSGGGAGHARSDGGEGDGHENDDGEAGGGNGESGGSGSSGSGSSSGSGGSASGDVGVVDGGLDGGDAGDGDASDGLVVTVGSDIGLTSLEWNVSGPNTYSGAVQVTNPHSIEFVVGGILAASGYILTLTATDTNSDPCSGASTAFDIKSGAVTTVVLDITCVQAGDAIVSVDVVANSVDAAADGGGGL